MLQLRRGLVLAALLGALVAAGSASAETVPPPSLTGETFAAGPNSTVGEGVYSVTFTCNADQSGTFDFTASGIAAGPYPGTFVESGTVTVDPSASTGAVVTFHAQFTIMNELGATIVNGTKDLVADTASTGACYSDPFSFDTLFATAASYSATIDAGSGSYRDSGLAHAAGEAADVFGFFAPAAGAPEGAFSTFSETFDTSNGVVPVGTTGKVTGGGWILGTTMTDRVSFGFEAQTNPNGLHATCTVVDHSTKTKIKCLGADSLVVTGTHATFSGPAIVDGVATRYRIDVDDLGEPGRGIDTFKIVTDSGYVAAGPLFGGNIQIHRS